MGRIIRPAATPVIILFLMTAISCESLFRGNLFEDMDRLDLSGMSTAEKADAVLSGAIENLDEDEADELIGDLEALYNDESQNRDTRKQAAAAAATVELTSSGADDTVNNLGSLASDMASGDLEIDNPEDLLESVFSDDSGEPLSSSEIETQLTSMLEAAAALEAYGDVLGEGGEAPAGVDAEQIAITAMVVGLVDVSGATPTQLAEAIANPSGAPDSDGDGTPDAFESLPDMTNFSEDPAGTLFADNPGLANTIEGSPVLDSVLGLFAG